MTPDRWHKIEEIFNLVVEAEPAAQAALLAQHCGGDETLRRELEALLHSETKDDFLQNPIKDAASSLPRLNQADLIGQDLGAYHLLEKIGQGGMGIVYRARDTRLERPVALKLLPPEFVFDAARVRRFRQEARAISTLNHPNILTIHEIGEAQTTNGTAHFIATEFVEGCNLRAAMKENELTLGAVLDVLIQTATALSAAHAAGVIHRDIKPENLMRRPDGVVKVLDFGLAKFAENKVDASPPGFSTAHTNPGLIMGTVSYMSPEQARGLEVDERTDIFSLGVVAYELLTGQPAFAGATTGDVLAALLEREPTPLSHYAPSAPAALQRIISRAVAKDRAARYQKCAELLTDLKALKQELELAAHLKRSGDTPVNSASLGLRVGRASAPNDATERATRDVPARTTTALASTVQWLKTHRGFTLAGALLLVVVGAIVMVWQAGWFKRNNETAIESVAVLPFVNVNGDAQLEYLAEGVTEGLMQSLQQIPALRVMARGTVYSYKGREVDPRQVGEALRVQAVINGRLQIKGEEILLAAELVNARDGARLWGTNYQRPLKDLAAVQAELARAVSGQLSQQFGAQPAPSLAQPQQNAKAYRLYLLGNYHVNKQDTENVLKALDYYQQALALDPAYALAHTGVSNVYAYLSSRTLTSQEAMPKARAAALKALELNSSLAEAHYALAIVKCWGDWDWQGAEQEFKRALELNPNLAVTRTLYANTLSFQKRFAEFHREIVLAQQLDPLSPLAIEMYLWGLYFERRYDDVLTEGRRLQSLDPNYGRVYAHIALAYGHKGQLREAIAAAEKGLALQPFDSLMSVLAYLYAVAGQPDKARQLLTELEHTSRQRLVTPFNFARIHVGLGEHDRAFTRLQESYLAHSEFLFSLPVDPIYDPLRTDPRYAELVRNIGLQP